MPIRRLLLSLLLLNSFFALCMEAGAQQSARVAPADILIVHGKIYTLDSKKPWAEAIAIRKGKILAVGSALEVEKFRGIGTRRIDAGGKLVLPGLTDCHIHFLDGSLSLDRVNLDSALNVPD